MIREENTNEDDDANANEDETQTKNNNEIDWSILPIGKIEKTLLEVIIDCYNLKESGT